MLDKVKIGRNESCPCGSNLKYKKCCLIKEESERRKMVALNPNEGLKNEFRDEVKKQEVSPAELLRRDKLVMLKQLQVRKILVESDRVHLLASLETLKDFAAEIAEIGDCEGKDGVIVNLKSQVESLMKQIEQCKLPRREEISLMLLESELIPEIVAGREDKDTASDDEL